MLRLFFAITLKNHELLNRLFIQCKQKLDSAGQIRWVKPEQLHITIAFIGEVKQDVANSIIQHSAELFTQLPEIKLKYDKNLVFYHQHKPTVVGIKFDTNNEILKLKEQTDALLRKHNIEVDKRPFVPHITFGRVKQAFNSDAFRKFEFESYSQIKEFEAEQYSLYQSVLNFFTGAQYTPLWTTKFGNQ